MNGFAMLIMLLGTIPVAILLQGAGPNVTLLACVAYCVTMYLIFKD